MKIDLQNLQEYREDNRLEAKLAQKGLPASLWETYSAFANTDGGLILLGVKENDDYSFETVGVSDVEKLVSDFWNTINNTQKISVNVLTNQCVQVIEVDGKYQVTYNPERTIVRLEIEDADNAKNDPNVPKDVQINDPLSTAEDSIIDPNVPRDVQINGHNVQINDPLSAAEDSINDPNVPKDVQINDHNVQIKLTERQQTILAILKEDGRVTLEVVSQKLNVSTKTVYRDMLRLQKLNLIDRVGARKKGVWKVL